MSHLRNLFHRPSGAEPSLASLYADAERYAEAERHAEAEHHPDLERQAEAERRSPSDATAAAPAFDRVEAVPKFPVEMARIGPENRLVYYDHPRGSAADRFRLLRMRLMDQWKRGKLKRLLITSPLPRDGKSTVLINLATALAERGKRSVLVIDADLHQSSIAAHLGLKGGPGLIDCLHDESVSPLSHIRCIEPLGWHLLPAGQSRQNPTELLQTPAMSNVLQKVSPQFDWVLIDSPPVIPVTDAVAIQQHVDATMLVVRSGRTPRAVVAQAFEMLGPHKLIGAVLNGVDLRNQPYYEMAYNQMGSAPQED